MTLEQIIKKLDEGNKRYISDQSEEKLKNSHRRSTLSKGQNPHSIVLACADSRVVPEIIYDMGLGDLFVVRVAGNIANSASIASIEYAIKSLGTKVLVILGHENCGAIAAATNKESHSKHLDQLISHIVPAIQECGHDASLSDIGKMHVSITSHELQKKSEIIGSAVTKGQLKILKGYYEIKSGKVQYLD